MNRFKRFYPAKCSGKWRHAVCIFDLRGMTPLYDPASPYLFVNKIVMHMNPEVMDVTEEWFYHWQEFYYKHADKNLTDLNFYRDMPQVRYQAHRKNSIY